MDADLRFICRNLINVLVLTKHAIASLGASEIFCDSVAVSLLMMPESLRSPEP